MQTSECIAYIKCKQPETWLIKKAKVQTVTVTVQIFTVYLKM